MCSDVGVARAYEWPTGAASCGAQDLLQPAQAEGFQVMRAALRDVEEENISLHFRPASAFIAAALDGGGVVLGAHLLSPHC